MSVCDCFFKDGNLVQRKTQLEHSVRLITALILAFKYLRGHPSCTSLVVGHVSLDVTRCSEVAYLQHSPTCHEEKTKHQRQD